MSNRKYHLRSAAVSALGFGAGFVVGSLLSYFIFATKLLDSVVDLFGRGHLIAGLLLIIIVTSLGGAAGGGIGGLTLSYAHKSTRRWGYAWRGALSFAATFSLVIIPLILAVSMISFYELEEVSAIGLMVPFWIIGAVFGAFSSLILGLLTAGRQFWRVLLFGTIGFAFGGSALGYGLYAFLLGVIEQKNTAVIALFLAIFICGAIGGGTLGFLYSWLALRKPAPWYPARFSNWFKQQSLTRKIIAAVGLIILFLALRALWLISPFTAQSAPLESVLESKTVGTHWAEPFVLVENVLQPALFATLQNTTALTWVEGTDVYYLIDSEKNGTQSTPVNVSNSQKQSSNPQIAVDSTGNAHLVWVETTGPDKSEILYSRCSDSSCTPALSLSNTAELSCLTVPATQNNALAVAINQGDTLMAVWLNGQQGLVYSSWPANGGSQETLQGCIPLDIEDDETVKQPRLAGGGEGTFELVFAQLDSSDNGDVYYTQFKNNSWSPDPKRIDEGVSPEIFVDSAGQTHLAWCNSDGEIDYWNSSGDTNLISFPGCTGRPGIAQGGNNAIRLVWYSNEAENVQEVIHLNTLLYESFQTEEGWTEPAIIAQTHAAAQPALTVDGSSRLHLAWTANAGEPSPLNYASHTEYDCSEVELSTTEQAIYSAVRQEKFRPATDPIPYCYNQYDTLLHAPNPLPAFSDADPTPNGTFDHFADLAKTAQHEVVFATMWYDSFNKADNPGRVLGKAIAELYQNLKANPSQYPKGLTVRILLGNPPSFALFPTFNNQATSLISDLYAAGVPEMSNDDIGWNLEIGNYSGSWPHSHTKMMIVDGKTVQSVGYNMQHTHLPTDHPSGKGKGRVDVGLQVTGPVAQTSLRAFDDLWQASVGINCTNINTTSFFWILSCSTYTAQANHVPEVLRYYIPGQQTDNAFSIFRTQNFSEGDEAYYSALASATETMDIIHINFSLDLICVLNILIDACNYANRVEYMDAMMKAIEENDVKARILVSDIAWVGIENNIAIDTFEEELAHRGLSDNVEIRYFEQDMHIKSALIDNQFLFIGNQNFHYSAWGNKGGLAEYNLGTADPQAVEDFQRYFNYYWERATKRE